MTFTEVVENLKLLDGMERFEYLFSIAKHNTGIDESEKTKVNQIFGCTSTAYLIVDNFEPVQIRTDSDSQFVKGLLQILKLYINGKTIEQVLQVDHTQLMDEIGMENAISSQRTNGFYAAIMKLQKILNSEDINNGKKGN